jgi:hypothetical protein
MPEYYKIIPFSPLCSFDIKLLADYVLNNNRVTSASEIVELHQNYKRNIKRSITMTAKKRCLNQLQNCFINVLELLNNQANIKDQLNTICEYQNFNLENFLISFCTSNAAAKINAIAGGLFVIALKGSEVIGKKDLRQSELKHKECTDINWTTAYNFFLTFTCYQLQSGFNYLVPVDNSELFVTYQQRIELIIKLSKTQELDMIKWANNDLTIQSNQPSVNKKTSKQDGNKKRYTT